MMDTLTGLVHEYGYLLFFLAFSLGPFGIPIPNEVTILTGGILSNEDDLNGGIVYLLILCGLITAVTIAYFAGRLLGKRFVPKFRNNRHFQKAERLITRHGNLAMAIGFFIPIVRYIVPVFIGFSSVPFPKFALISYCGAFVWTSAFFSIGRFFGDQIL